MNEFALAAKPLLPVIDIDFTRRFDPFRAQMRASALSAVTDFSCWFLVRDDQHDRDVTHRRNDASAYRFAALRAAVENPRAHVWHTDPKVEAFADSVCRLYSYLGGRWNAPFAGHFCSVIDAYQLEFRDRVAGTAPTVAEYLELRCHTFGHWVWLGPLELTARGQLPPEVRDSDPYLRAGVASQEFCA